MTSFTNQIQIYSGNRSTSTEGIAIKHFHAPKQPSPFLASGHLSRHAAFHPFLSGDRNQDAATTAALSKGIVELLKNRQICFVEISTICKSTNGCVNKYICSNALYLMSILAHA